MFSRKAKIATIAAFVCALCFCATAFAANENGKGQRRPPRQCNCGCTPIFSEGEKNGQRPEPPKDGERPGKPPRSCSCGCEPVFNGPADRDGERPEPPKENGKRAGSKGPKNDVECCTNGKISDPRCGCEGTKVFQDRPEPPKGQRPKGKNDVECCTNGKVTDPHCGCENGDKTK